MSLFSPGTGLERGLPMRRIVAKFIVFLAVFAMGLVILATQGTTANLTFDIKEVDPQPVLLTFAATPGVVLLCDTTGVNRSIPLFRAGAWGCWSNAGNTGVLKDASDVITFSARPNDIQFPSQALMCSDVDPMADMGDTDPACAKANFKAAGNFALQEEGIEGRGPENTAYEPPGVGFAGYATIQQGTETFFAAYVLSSDPATRVAEPSSFSLMLGGLAIALASRRARGLLFSGAARQTG